MSDATDIGPDELLLMRSSLADDAAGVLRRMILSGQMKPGERLVQETMSKRLGISRTPLRDAMRTLQAEGLLEADKATMSVVSLDIADAADLYRVRAVVDEQAARRAARITHTPQDIAQLKEVVLRTREAAREVAVSDYVTANAHFHELVLRASGNRALLSQQLGLVRLTSLLWYTRLGQDADRMRASAEEHAGILDAIIAQDSDRAAALAGEHIQMAVSAWFGEQ